MKADFSRDTFDPGKRYSRVLMQQGRVQLDADWNEQTSILLHYMRVLARDLIGPHGAALAPDGAAVPSAGFGIVVNANEIVGSNGALLKDSKDKSDQELFKQLQKKLDAGDFIVNPGRYYVDGWPVENVAPVASSDLSGWSTQYSTDFGKPPCLVYLDVWEREVTFVEDGHIREVALGGADTCARAKIEWQIRVWKPTDPQAAVTCDDLAKLPKHPGDGRLRARAKRVAQTSPCVISPDSRYTGAGNQLYRVEIHQGGAAGTATFKWSRENGSVIFSVVKMDSVDTSHDPNTVRVTLASLGRDERLGLREGDWVELVDAGEVLQNRADALLQVVKIEPDALAVTLALSGPLAIAEDAPLLLRRWDQAGDAKSGGALPVVEYAAADMSKDAKWTTLEDGVEIWFEAGGTYATGDYWLIPARVITGDLEWPAETDADGKVVMSNGVATPAALKPRGPRHYYAPLAHSEPGNARDGRPVVTDCRCKIQRVSICPEHTPARRRNR